jgi:hypothetical protein
VRRRAGPIGHPVALACAVLVLATFRAGAGPAAAAEPGLVYEILTTAVGVSVSSTQRPAASVVTGGLVDTSSGFSSSAVSSAGASASAAAAFYPGDLVATGPALLCSEFLPCPVTPPTYPLVAQASWPERPSGSADSPAPVGTARATAGAEGTDGLAELANGSVPGSPLPLSVGSQTTKTRAWADDAGGHVRSTSALHDIALGPLRIATLVTTDDVDVTPAGHVSDRPRVELTGVTFAGQAAGIDDKGVHLLGVSAPLPDRTLAQQGAEVRAIGTSKTDGRGAARSTAGGLQVRFSIPVQGVPPVVPGLPSADRTYLGTITVGGVGAAVGVGAPGDVLLAGLPAPPAASLDARLLSSPVLRQTASAPVGSGPAAVAPTNPLAVLAGHRRPALPQPDLRWLALALAVVPTSLLLGWRFTRRRPA